MHPVMSKFQAHMALAAASQIQHHKPKHQHNYGFTPPSQMMSNYANFGPATSNPFWHTGMMKNNNAFPGVHDNNRDFHQHFHSAPVASQAQQQHQQMHHQQRPQQQPTLQNHHQQYPQQTHQKQHQQQNNQQQNLPNVHPSLITPFLDQVRLKQNEAANAEQKNSLKQSHDVNSQEINDSFEIINDVFSKHLVPPPNPSPSSFKPKPVVEKPEKVNKYNLSMPSPLQDASRFNYNHVVSTATPASESNFRPSASDNTYYSTEKPNVFIHLNRTKENVYKHHKLLHPSYTGGQRVRPSVIANLEKPFLPTPYRPEKEEEPLRDNYEPQSNFFTIEDAVTPHLSYEIIKSHIPVEEEPEKDVYTYHKRPEYDYTTKAAVKTTTTTEAPIEVSSQKPRQKLRRRKPKPKQQQQLQQSVKESNEVQVTEKPSYKPNRLRGNIKNVDTQTEQNNLRTRNRVNHPSRVRNKINVSSTASSSTTSDFDSTVRTSTEEEKQEEITQAQKVATENYANVKAEESSEQPENVKRRVRLRFKNKLRSNAMETADFKPKLNDNQIADTENESFAIKPSDETTEPTATESGINEIRSSLKLPNLKLRNDVLTTLPTTADTISTSAEPSSTKGIEPEETVILNKIANRPRFSIKEYKRKQLTTSSTNAPLLTSSTTASTSTKPDSQRFNRIRLNLNRRRNETNEPERSIDEDTEVPRKRFSNTRGFSTTTESTIAISSSPKRGSSPKRTFQTRNFTKPTVNLNESETTTKLLIKTSTTNRPASPSLRSRIQSYNKRKESSNEVTESPQDAIKNINVSAETAVTQDQTTTASTEAPVKHETSIMKIAKTPPSINIEKSSTSNILDDVTITSSSDFDLTGSPSEHSQRVAELTFSGNDNNFKSANIGTLSRRIPNYFTISTDDPILPIQAFFPQIKTSSDY